MRVGALPSKPRKVLRDTRAAPLRGAFLASLYDLKETLNRRPGSIGICNLSTATWTEHSWQPPPADLARPRRESRKLPLALANCPYLGRPRGDAKAAACNGSNGWLLTIVTAIPISGTITTTGPEACAPIARP
jgi:hypothetical protein